MKPSQLFLLALLLAMIAGIGSYLYFSKGKKELLPAAFALPPSASIIYQGADPQKDYELLRDNPFYKRLMQESEAFRHLDKEFTYFDSLIKNTENFESAIDSRPVVLSLHVTSAENYQLLLLMQTANAIDKNDLEDRVKSLRPQARIFERIFENKKLYDVKTNGQEQREVSQISEDFTFSFFDGILALSRNPLLVEEAISSYSRNKKSNSPLVEKMLAVQNGGRIFFNFTRLPALINTYLAPDEHEAIKSLENLADYGVYEWKLDKDNFQLYGTVQTLNLKSRESSKNKGAKVPESEWAVLLDQKPQKPAIADILPQQTGLFMCWGIDDFNRYFKEKNKTDTLALDNLGTNVKSWVESMQGWVGKEWAYVIPEPSGTDSLPEPLLAIRPADGTTAIGSLREMSKKFSEKHWETAAPVSYRNYTIERAGFTASFSLLFGRLFESFNRPYYTMLGDYVVFCNNSSAIQRCIDAFLDNSTLVRSADWQRFSAKLSSESNFLLYLNPSRALLLGNHFIRNSFRNQYTENLPLYALMNGFGFQLVSNQTNFYSQLMLSQANRAESSELAWSLNTEDEISTKPFVFLNPKNRKKEIVFQDKSNNLYLVSNSGGIVWKKPLGEPIVGDIAQIDLYKTGETQFLFSTGTRLVVLDHDGQDMGGYPIRLGVPATTGIALFDFDHNRSYTYFVSGRNRISGFYADGKPIPVWSPMNIDGALSIPMQSFSLNDKTYLFGVTDKGTLYVWDRKGSPKIKPLSTGSGFLNPFYFSAGNDLESSTLFTIDTTGTLFRIRLDGTITKTFLTVKPAGAPLFFEYTDIKATKPQYLISTGETVAAYSGEDTTALWKIKTSSPISFSPKIIKLSGRTYLGCVMASQDSIRFFVPGVSGSIPGQERSFRGSTSFTVDDLFMDTGNEMLVGGRGKILYVYRLGR